MSTLVAIVAVMALPVAGLVLAPTNRALARLDAGLVIGVILLWLVAFWAAALAVAWPLVGRVWPLIGSLVDELLHKTPLIIEALRLLPL
jgi:hypothetical protein